MNGYGAEKIMHKGIEAVELRYNGYYAVVAHTIGSNVLRFRDENKGMEIFRYSDKATVAEIINSSAVWGLPTLYLPNRFDKGILKTSDAEYRLPVNEVRFKNHIHGFIHNRVYKIKEMGADKNRAFVTNVFTYDETDYFYNCFPVKMTVEITVELSNEGLRHTVELTNNSDKMMPVSVCTHTTINAPFVDGGRQENIRMQLPCRRKIQLNKRRWLPTGRTAKLNSWDREFKTGTKCPVLQEINNEMYTAGVTVYKGRDFHGCIMTDTESGKKICYETDEDYKFWLIWNNGGFMNYFCPEPMTAQINAPNLDMPSKESGYTEIRPKDKYSVSQRFFTVHNA